jgi:hypothetical protein
VFRSTPPSGGVVVDACGWCVLLVRADGSPNKKGFKTEVLKPFLAVSALGLKHQFDNGQ